MVSGTCKKKKSVKKKTTKSWEKIKSSLLFKFIPCKEAKAEATDAKTELLLFISSLFCFYFPPSPSSSTGV